MPKAINAKADEAKALYLQGHKLVEIAKQLDLPEGTVRRWKCTYKWDGVESSAHNKKKPNARNKGGAPKGNKNAVGHGAPKGSQNAKRWGLFSKYIPQDTMDLLGITAETSPIDLLWDQIQIAYVAIIRAQQICFVKDALDKTRETVMESDSASGGSTAYSVQQAWEKQANFMTAQAKAQSELRNLIKQYDEMVHQNWDIATEEQKARLQLLQAKLNDGAGQAEPVTIINDTQSSSNQ